MQIAKIMSPKVEWVGPLASVREAAKKMRDRHIGSLPVMEDGELVGMITDRDICCRGVAVAKDTVKTKVRSLMSADVETCFSDQELADAARLMERKHVRRLAVIDREQKLVGFLSVDDLARYDHDLASAVLIAAAPTH